MGLLTTCFHPLISFDKLRMSGIVTPLVVSLSNHASGGIPHTIVNKSEWVESNGTDWSCEREVIMVDHTDGLIQERAIPGPWAKRWRWLHMPGVASDATAILAFVAAILATNYALASFPNLKLFDLMVFLAGYTLGFRRGAAVAVTAWLVYGNFNPYGPTTLPLLATVMAAETVYAGAGALVWRMVAPGNVRLLPSRSSLFFAAAAVVSTLTYDVAANLYTGISWAMFAGSADYSRWIVTALFNPGALFFTAAHLSSNVLFFAAFAPLLIKGAEKIRKARG